MGMIYKPSDANILMNHFEKKFIYPFITANVLIYLRFIDDMFFMSTGNRSSEVF